MDQCALRDWRPTLPELWAGRCHRILNSSRDSVGTPHKNVMIIHVAPISTSIISREIPREPVRPRRQAIGAAQHQPVCTWNQELTRRAPLRHETLVHCLTASHLSLRPPAGSSIELLKPLHSPLNICIRFPQPDHTLLNHRARRWRIPAASHPRKQSRPFSFLRPGSSASLHGLECPKCAQELGDGMASSISVEQGASPSTASHPP
jgi:hypothetical protein